MVSQVPAHVGIILKYLFCSWGGGLYWLCSETTAWVNYV